MHHEAIRFIIVVASILLLPAITAAQGAAPVPGKIRVSTIRMA
jgi:hypothetical protein